MRLRAAPATDKNRLFDELRKNADLTTVEQEQLGRLMEVLVPVLNAANTIQGTQRSGRQRPGVIRALSARRHREIFKDKHNVFGMTPEAWLDKAIEIKGRLVLSLCNTAHPTNFHTPFGRKYEKRLISDLATDFKPGTGLSDEKLTNFATTVRNTCRDMKEQGMRVTYTEKVTVGEETETERDILHVQKDAMKQVQKAWDDAVTNVSAGLGAIYGGFGRRRA